MATFQHPANGYRQSVTRLGSFFGCLVFGIFYFAYKGVWKHVLISCLAALCTLGISWLIYPFFAFGCVRHAYLEKGWQEVGRQRRVAPKGGKASGPSFDHLP